MIADFHFIRPLWFIALIPLFLLLGLLWRNEQGSGAWSKVCDSHLLEHLIAQKTARTSNLTSTFTFLLYLFLSAFFLILSAAGPSWHRLPVPTYKARQPVVLVLDLSEAMLDKDLAPNRLERAKFKLHDILAKKNLGQFGLIVFTGEPFVVSPLTDDGQTIAALLATLTPNVMPVGGQNLSPALEEAAKLIHQSGFSQGQILVLTATSPRTQDIRLAQQFAAKNIKTSIMPFVARDDLNPLFQEFATSGGGRVLPYSLEDTDLHKWIAQGLKSFVLNKEDNIPFWRDEGPYFLIPALLFLLPFFRKNSLQRISS